ncbi:hypothetical protein LX36DRAFT_427420 [Colletotrichum falcatum]|nr:hypothetical protein LX36DRAFT_427420 [Colletotrichum falcatum]
MVWSSQHITHTHARTLSQSQVFHPTSNIPYPEPLSVYDPRAAGGWLACIGVGCNWGEGLGECTPSTSPCLQRPKHGAAMLRSTGARYFRVRQRDALFPFRPVPRPPTKLDVSKPRILKPAIERGSCQCRIVQRGHVLARRSWTSYYVFAWVTATPYRDGRRRSCVGRDTRDKSFEDWRAQQRFPPCFFPPSFFFPSFSCLVELLFRYKCLHAEGPPPAGSFLHRRPCVVHSAPVPSVPRPHMRVRACVCVCVCLRITCITYP